jgi:hypothetical protein
VQQTKAAIKQTVKHPNSAKAWAGLVEARWTEAGNGSNYDTTTSSYTKSGDVQLNYAAAAWEKYLSVTNSKPDVDTSLLAGKIYQALSDWSKAAAAWQYVIQSSPTYALKGYECTALNALRPRTRPPGNWPARRPRRCCLARSTRPSGRRLSSQPKLRPAPPLN